MALSGWHQLMAGAPWFRGAGRFLIEAYSEVLPPPQLFVEAYDEPRMPEWARKDPWAWPVTEPEELLELRPGLEHVAARIVDVVEDLSRGRPVRGLSRQKLEGNPAWPQELADAGPLEHERHVVLMPLALSQTQDEKGRVRWTLFGASEQGPARGFWRSFFTAPRRQLPAEHGENFIRRLLREAHGLSEKQVSDLHRLGFRVLAIGDCVPQPWWRDGPLPGWIDPYVWEPGDSLAKVRYLLTFRPFAALPPAVRRAYLKGRLHLLPCPGSLVPWGTPGSVRLAPALPFAVQVPLLHCLDRYESYPGLRIPQAGWLHVPRPNEPVPTDPRLAIKNTYQRTHRNQRLHRHEDPLRIEAKEEKLVEEHSLVRALFSTEAEDMGLYGKPLCQNVQLWTDQYEVLLDGPRAGADAIEESNRRVLMGGLFGYRFQYPAMRVGRHEVYWHRPLVAYRPHGGGAPVVLPDPLQGYLTAYHTDAPEEGRPVELWPRFHPCEPFREACALFHSPHDQHGRETQSSIRILVETQQTLGRPLPRSLATRLLVRSAGHTIDEWLAERPDRTGDPARARRLGAELERLLAPPEEKPELLSLTFDATARRSFEVAYWNTIRRLAEGRFLNKCNADCVDDEPTRTLLRKLRRHQQRDLEPLGEYLLDHYDRCATRAGMEGKALVGDLPFHWHSDFTFLWMGGYVANQTHQTEERDLIVVVPGKDRSRAIVLADHYDTAYMLDRYDPNYGGIKARIAAAGADDNHSATATLMLAAPIFLEMSARGQLGCDVWLVHLTGEEFPADCLGARHLSQLLVEGRMCMRLRTGGSHDLSQVRVQGVYVMDMIAHNNDRERDVFQISPGVGRPSLWLAEQAHAAAESWNALAPVWNNRPSRRGRGRGQRSKDGRTVPAVAAHPILSGEVRMPTNPRSTLYNTDGQVFSDAGIPVVLFMENYDINRSGYHDTHDTMENIDLDYGSALAAIAIESAARAACEPHP
jgi:hypothetical protein